MAGGKQQVLVVGLGRFGSSVARELQALGHEVLAVDASEEAVNRIAPDVTHALELDASDEDALRAAGAADFRIAVVAISSDAEASIFATMALRRLGVPLVIAKARSELHGDILRRVGADRVVYPEREMGIQVAHTLSVPNILDHLQVAPGFSIEKMTAPRGLLGRRFADLERNGQGLRVLALRRGTRVVFDPASDETISEGDELVVAGRDEDFARLRG